MDDYYEDGGVEEQPVGQPEVRAAFMADPQVRDHLMNLMARGQVQTRYEVIIRDVATGSERVMLVDWPFADLDEVTLMLYRSLTGEDPSDLEGYFWTLWRGWAGQLTRAVAQELPIKPYVVDMVEQGIPLRGQDLEYLVNGLCWHFANNRAEFGDGSWREGTLSAPHNKSRKIMREFLLTRMEQFIGPDFRDQPVT